MGPIVYPETSVTNYQSTLCNIPEEQRYSNIFLIYSSSKYLVSKNFEVSHYAVFSSFHLLLSA